MCVCKNASLLRSIFSKRYSAEHLIVTFGDETGLLRRDSLQH